MKVDKVYQNYENRNLGKSSSKPQNYATYNVSFAKKPPKALSDRIMDLLPGKTAIKFMKKLEWLKGEIGGILITAIGTGLVAPFPIAFNPFVKAPKDATEEQKKDLENTKKYTAMRQPISALLAIAFQVVALKPIDKVLEKWINTPEYAQMFRFNCDQSAINSKASIEKQAKKKIKAKNPSVKGDAYDELLAATKKEIENSQVSKVAEKFQKTGKITVGKRSLDNKSLAELVNLQIDDYIKDATKLKIDNEGLSYYSNRAKTLLENEAHLTNIFKDVPSDSTKVAEFVEGLISKETNPEVKALLEEIIERPAEIQKSRINRTLSRIQTIKNMCGGEYSYSKYIDAMTTRNAKVDNIITDLMHAKIKEPKLATEATIKETIEKIAESCHFDKSNKLMNTILHDTDTFNFDKEKLSSKIYKDITKQYKEFIRNNYKSLNQIVKIIIGVCITLPITCNVLNWVYPRIMDKFFPELAGSKKAQKAREGK